MKLSKMKTREAAQAIASIAAPVSAITKDKAVAEIIGLGVSKRLKDLELEKAIPLFLDVIPVLLSTHYDDTIRIVSFLTEKDVDEIDNQEFTQTVEDIKGIADYDLIALFRLSTSSAQAKSSK